MQTRQDFDVVTVFVYYLCMQWPINIGVDKWLISLLENCPVHTDPLFYLFFHHAIQEK